jgi:uncharacterized protein
MSQPEPRCPICNTPRGATAAHAPFCSSRCQLIDLGNWLGERYVVPAGPADTPDQDTGAHPPSDEEGDPSHDKGSR